MNELVKQINFKRLYFNGNVFEQQTIQEGIDHLAHYLLQHIRSDSPFILFTACNHIKTVVAYYAILKTGRIAVALDPLAKPIDAGEIVGDVEPAAIISINKNVPAFDYASEIVFRPQPRHFDIRSDLNDVCTLVYTNAEDGYLKGAMITEKNMLAQIYAFTKATHLNEQSVSCVLLPFSHLYGLMNGIILPTHAGGVNIITDLNLFQLSKTMQDVYQGKADHFYSIPPVYYLLKKVPDIKKLVNNIRLLVSGAVQLPTWIFDDFYNKTGKKIREGYGLTECSPAVALDCYENEPVVSSMGKALPKCEVKILDDYDNECDTGKIGEICVKGDNVFKGYFNQENTTNAILRNEWLHTGDYGKKDAKGYLFFSNLKKDMINVGGNKVYPKHLERLLRLNENVISVKVFGESSIIQGQTVAAKIELRKNSAIDQEKFKHWCMYNINNNILPKTWQFE